MDTELISKTHTANVELHLVSYLTTNLWKGESKNEKKKKVGRKQMCVQTSAVA